MFSAKNQQDLLLQGLSRPTHSVMAFFKFLTKIKLSIIHHFFNQLKIFLERTNIFQTRLIIDSCRHGRFILGSDLSALLQ